MNTPKTDALMSDKTRDGNDLPALCRQMEEGLRLAVTILEKLPMPTLDLACRRAAIKHNGDKPMEYLRDILSNDQVELPPNGGSESKKGVVGG